MLFEMQIYGTTFVPIADMSITIEDVRKKLDALNPNKATGPDEIPPRLLKELAAVLAGPIAIIMNKSIQEGNLPSIWKKANVVPIFKKGKKNMSGNYRPVSLTSVTCKILEGLVRQKLVEHLTDNNLVTDYQHGFVSGRSCSTNLLAVLDPGQRPWRMKVVLIQCTWTLQKHLIQYLTNGCCTS